MPTRLLSVRPTESPAESRVKVHSGHFNDNKLFHFKTFISVSQCHISVNVAVNDKSALLM